MRVAIVIERMDPARGGRETSTAQIAEELAHRGHEVIVVCQESAWDHPTIGIHVLPVSGGRLARAKQFVQKVQALIASDPFDAVLTTLPIPGATVYQPRGGTFPAQAEASARRRGPIRGKIMRAFEPFNRMRRFMSEMERQVMADHDCRLLAVSDMVRLEFATHYGRPDGQVVFNAVTPPTMDAETRQHERQRLRYMLGMGPKDALFLCVAKNFRLKGVLEMMSAYAEWVDSDPIGRKSRLVVVGRDNTEGYARIAGMRQVGKLVTFIPPTDDISRFYAAADVCVLLSWYDPCSRVVLEAATWGVPSITTRYNGASEIAARGAGIVVDSPKDRSAIRGAMAELAGADRRAVYAQACDAVASELSIQRHVDELEAVFQERFQE